MSQPADSELSREGATDIYIPVNHTDHGPGKIQGRVFYNRQMAFNRDVSVMFFSSPQVTVRTAIDAMSATGVRAVRIAKEARPDIHFDICDRDSVAAEFIKENIVLNGLENCTAINNDLRCQLAQEYYDYVDLDPFGTPVEFIPAALQALEAERDPGNHRHRHRPFGRSADPRNASDGTGRCPAGESSAMRPDCASSSVTSPRRRRSWTRERSRCSASTPTITCGST